MERIGKEVQRNLSSAGGGVGLALSEITACWSRALGPAIARNAWPLRVARDGTLHVATASATWAFELDRMSPEIRERLVGELGDAAPARIRFRPGPVPEHGAEPTTATSEPPRKVSPEAARLADEAAASIEDPELREMVKKAARASLADPRSDRGFW